MKLEDLLALTAQPPRVSVREAQRVAAELYGLHARAQPLPGERDRNFLLLAAGGRKLVLKFIDQQADDGVIAGQSAVLAHLAEQDPGLPVPGIIRTLTGAELHRVPMAGGDGSGDRAAGAASEFVRVRLVTYLPGTPIADARVRMPRLTSPADPAPAGRLPGGECSGALLHSTGQLLGRLDRALAGFFHPALAQPIVWDVRHAPLLLPLLPDVRPASLRDLVARTLEPMPRLLRELRGLRAQAIHGDGHPGNLLVGSDPDTCTGIIDLGDLIHAPLALEIAVSMAGFLLDGLASPESLAELLQGFTRVQPLQARDIALLYDLMGARIAVGMLIHTWRQRNCAGKAGSVADDRFTRISQQALEELTTRDRQQLTAHWQELAGIGRGVEVVGSAGIAPTAAAARRVAAAPASRPSRPVELLRRRHRALGANAELSYDRPLHLIRGDGVWVYTAEGERLLDAYNNVPHVGHAHPQVVEAIADQARRIASNTRYLDERIIEYVERLSATLPPELDACLFVNSGSEANDVAWRIARAHTGQGGALVMAHAYHGITDAITALSPAVCQTVPPHVEQLAAPPAHESDQGAAAAAAGIATAADTLAAASERDVARGIARLSCRGFKPAALMIDSALTSTGIFDPPPSWAAPLEQAVRRAGGLIIGDEVQYGLGRSGSDFWGFNRRGYRPDIVTLGKPVGNGYPIGVVITRREILERFQRQSGFFSTFGGNPVAGAAGLAVLDVLEQQRLLENAQTTGDYFAGRLRQLLAKYPLASHVRGHGLMIGVEIGDGGLVRRLVNGMRAQGVLIGSEGPLGNVLKLRPPMPFRPVHADIVVEALGAVLLSESTG